MPRLKRLSGDEVISIFESFGFNVITQSGSHVKLRRIGSEGEKQTLVVPLHNQLDTGTCRSILRQATRYIPPEALKPFFYTE